jgi:G3E family GTPase
MENQQDERIPVTVLTGYLGAGKTTLLNHVLKADHGRRYAVIVNEFGETGIDNELIVESEEEIYEMNNGCVCCTVRGDLINVLQTLLRRKGRFDAIIVETTGLADPAPVAQTFFMDEDMRDSVKLDAVVALADARHLPLRLKDSTEAVDQIAFADVIVLNKTDLVDVHELQAVESAVRQINPVARIIHAHRANVALDAILDRGAFDLQRVLENDPHFLDEEIAATDHNHVCDEHCDHDDHHHHNHIDKSGIDSVSLTAGELDPERFFPWIQKITEIDGPGILRLKGILAFSGDSDRFVLQGIHMLLEGDHQRPWRDDEARRSRLVFIGRNLDREKLERTFAACAA